MSALWPVQEALVARLQANATLMTKVSGVFDGEAWEGEPLPYIVVGSSTEAPAHTFGRAGWSDTITVHIWAAGGMARRDALEILDLVDASLADPLAISGHQTARLRREFGEVLTDPDGSRHVPARYRVTTRETA